MDTPARAARVPRPQTRAWRQMLAQATEQSIQAAEIRIKLRSHLAAADRLATKRQEKVEQAKTQATNLTTSSQLSQEQNTPVQRRDLSEHPMFVLCSLTTEWTQRVKALVQLQTIPKVFDLEPVVPWLALQLSDMRSKVVNAASVTVAAVAAAGCLNADQAAQLFVSAALGTHVTKQVMADARRAAALSCLHAQTDPQLFQKVAQLACTAAHHAVKKVALDALTEVTKSAKDVNIVATAVQKALGSAALDKSSEVRAAARVLKTTFENRFGETEWKKLFDALPVDASARLKDEGEYARSKTGPGMPSGRPTMKEIIRARREEMRRQKAAAMGGEKKGQKRSSVELNSFEREGGNKRGVLVDFGKENQQLQSS